MEAHSTLSSDKSKSPTRDRNSDEKSSNEGVEVASAKDIEFIDWLQRNGARWPKMAWPSQTPLGRGAVAVGDIATLEPIMEIPLKLIMSPVSAFADPVVGQILKDNVDLLRGDLLLTVFMMLELAKGRDSFYHPYLSTLPEPDCISQWSDKELKDLQDDVLEFRAKSRRETMRITYRRCFQRLCDKYPSEFNYEDFTFERYVFSWNTIQARAFGRRLPWTALVPLADSLNHSNVATKYDYNCLNNGNFRLFPSNTNSYGTGDEIFNSYGRRPNDNLLLDYGFSMPNNEWDSLEIPINLRSFEFYEHKVRLLRMVGISISQTLRIRARGLPLEMMAILRIFSLEKSEIDLIFDDTTNIDDENIRRYFTPEVAISKKNELSVLECCISVINDFMGTYFPTTYESDQVEMVSIQTLPVDANTNKDRLCSSLVYRLSRKKLVRLAVKKMTRVAEFLGGKDEEKDPSATKDDDLLAEFAAIDRIFDAKPNTANSVSSGTNSSGDASIFADRSAVGGGGGGGGGAGGDGSAVKTDADASDSIQLASSGNYSSSSSSSSSRSSGSTGKIAKNTGGSYPDLTRYIASLAKI